MRGTRERTWIWRLFGNQTDLRYDIPQAIYPFIDVTQNFPLRHSYGFSQKSAAGGPSTETHNLQPPVNKSWLVTGLSILQSASRASRIEGFIKANGGTGSSYLPIFNIQQTLIATGIEFPVAPMSGSLTGTGGGMINTHIYPIYLAGPPPAPPGAVGPLPGGEMLSVAWLNQTAADISEVRWRYLEFDLDSPPGA